MIRNINVVGERNVVAESAKQIFIVGSDNFIGDKCISVSLMNTSGCTVSGGLTNVSLTRCSGLSVVESNKVYVANKDVTGEEVYSVLYSNPALVLSAASTLEQTLKTYSLDPNVLVNTGDYIRIVVLGAFSSNGNNKTLNVKIVNNGVTVTKTYSSTLSPENVVLEIILKKTTVSVLEDDARVSGTYISNLGSDGVFSFSNYVFDSNQQTTISVTVQTDVATASDIAVYDMSVEMFKVK